MSVLDTAVKALPDGSFALDPAHSSVAFEVKHLGIATVRGRFTVISGSLTGGETPALEGVVGMASATTFDEQRDGHLASPDFFDAERYPEAPFRSTSFELLGDDRVRVVGDLTLKGVTKEIELTARSPAPPPTLGQRADRARAEGVSTATTSASSGTRRCPAAASCSRTTSRIVIDVSAVKGS